MVRYRVHGRGDMDAPLGTNKLTWHDRQLVFWRGWREPNPLVRAIDDEGARGAPRHQQRGGED